MNSTPSPQNKYLHGSSQSVKKIMMLAGEASGDLLASQLCKAIQKRFPNAVLFGMGGKKMRDVGVEILVNSDEIAVVGGLEILTHLSKIHAAFKTIKKAIKERQPDLLILVDYPGFNLRIAKFAKLQGQQVMFYVSPQIWAWRYNRINHIKKYIDHMAVLFSFEKDIYKKENMPVSFVGHPLVDSAVPTIKPDVAYAQFNLNRDKPIVALFPGSRKQEITRMLPIMMSAVSNIKTAIPDVQFILPLANSLNHSDINPFITADITVVKDNTYNVLSICDVAIAVSGTVTLEIALQRVPMIIIYKMARFSYWLAKRLIKLKHIGLCNIVAETEVAKELIQHDANAQRIADETIRFLKDSRYRQETVEKMSKIKENLGAGGGSERAADVVSELIEPSSRGFISSSSRGLTTGSRNNNPLNSEPSTE